MWCFFDESYPPEGGVTAIAACLMQSRTLQRLDREMFVARRTYYGDEHARDLTRELKGSDLLSRQSFKMHARFGESKNHAVAESVLNACVRMRGEHSIYLFGAVVYGAQDILRTASEPRLIKPLKSILNLVSHVGCAINPKDRINLVFDEQIGTKANVAAKIRQFVAGVDLPNVSHYPLSAVSNTSPGIQLSDIAAYIMGRMAVQDDSFPNWMTKLRQLEWSGRIEGRRKSGINFFEKEATGNIIGRRGWKHSGEGA